MTIDKDQAIEALGNMSVMELIALTKELETKWGVKAVPQMVQVEQKTAQKEESTQTEFSVMLVSVPADKKMNTIKLVREYLGMPLKESKELVEGAPKMLKEGMPKEEADAMKAKFTEAGAVVEMK
jgi:large subunit ribosomal protein L7/L12